MAVVNYFCGSELGGLEELQLVSREDLVGPRKAFLVCTLGLKSLRRMLFAKSFSVAEDLGSEVRSRNIIQSRYMSSIAAMIAWTWPRRMETVTGSPPLLLAKMTSSRVAFVTKAKNSFVTVME